MNRFPDKARVCFVGDSITANNGYVSHIAGYYREHFPKACVEFYNCGIAGATLKTTLAVFDEDIVPFAPTHIVLMTGINDAARHHLINRSRGRYDAMKEAFETFKQRLDIFAKRVLEIGAELILCTPMPYNEYLESELPVLCGSSEAMLGYADYIRAFSKEKGYPVCDYHAYITREITLSDALLYNPDRVHPNPLGHYFMAKCFLKFQEMDLPFCLEISECIKPWHDVTRTLRDTITVENFILKGDFSKNDEERLEIIKKFITDPFEDDNKDLFMSLAVPYPENKSNQKKNRDFVMSFMKKN